MRWLMVRLAAGIVIMQLAGCTLVQLHQESKAFYSATVLVGRVSAPTDWRGDMIVAAVSLEGDTRAIAHQIRLHEPGGYELIVPDGRYMLVGFGDADGDGQPGSTEPVGALATPVTVAGSGIVTLLDFSLSVDEQSQARNLMPATFAPPPHSTQVGAIADLDAPIFSADSGREGYWSPMEFFRRAGGNIYFLEQYDPARTPVIFVHGAAGSAQDFRGFFDALDRSRYQAWFFQYPSGASLDSMAHLFYWKLLNLQIRYGLQRVHIVAHSMGGLVVRRFVLNHGDQFPQLGEFVSISTPWGGETAAATGVKHSPAVVPSWRDMQPDGDFLRTLFERPLPAAPAYTLLFGHRGGYSLLRPNTDGVVTLASQLRPEAQHEARLVMGFDEDHVGILSARDVIDQVQRVLGADQQEGSAGAAGIRVRMFPPEQRDALTDNTLVLARAEQGATSAAKWQLLPMSATREVIGPIAPGVYDAHLLVPAFRTEPHWQRITVDPAGTITVDFQLTPRGVLTGFVGADGDALAYPAGSYRPPHATVRIHRIVLAGASGERVLIPRGGAEAELVAALLEGRDAAIGPAFSFVDLAEGDYVLTIEADGYETHRSTHRVVPGQVNPATPIVLRSL